MFNFQCLYLATCTLYVYNDSIAHWLLIYLQYLMRWVLYLFVVFLALAYAFYLRQPPELFQAQSTPVAARSKMHNGNVIAHYPISKNETMVVRRTHGQYKTEIVNPNCH